MNRDCPYLFLGECFQLIKAICSTFTFQTNNKQLGLGIGWEKGFSYSFNPKTKNLIWALASFGTWINQLNSIPKHCGRISKPPVSIAQWWKHYLQVFVWTFLQDPVCQPGVIWGAINASPGTVWAASSAKWSLSLSHVSKRFSKIWRQQPFFYAIVDQNYLWIRH